MTPPRTSPKIKPVTREGIKRWCAKMKSGVIFFGVTYGTKAGCEDAYGHSKYFARAVRVRITPIEQKKRSAKR